MSLYECNLCGADYCDDPKAIVLVIEKGDESEFGKIAEDELKKQGVSSFHNLRYSEVWNRYYIYLAKKNSDWYCESCYNKLIKEPVEKAREEAKIYWENYYENLRRNKNNE